MLCALFVGLQIGIPAAVLCYVHSAMWGFSLANTVLITFIVINLLICVWELALYYRHGALLVEHERRKKLGFYKDSAEGRKIRSSITMNLFRDYPISEMLQFEFWVHIWTEYLRYDDAYAHTETFQYTIDVCNGHSTPVSCIIFLISMFTPIFTPQVTGLIGALVFYQKWYGTFMYLWAYTNNNKGKHLTMAEYVFAVLATNGVWFTVPLYGLWASAQLITTGTFDYIH